MRIDIHTHFMPQEYIDALKNKKTSTSLGAEVIEKDGIEMVRQEQGFAYPVSKKMLNLKTRLAEMDARGIDIDVLSAPPNLYYYWAKDPEVSKWVTRTFNDSVADAVKNSTRFLGLGLLPLDNIENSLVELEYLVTKLGLKGVEIGGNVEGKGIWEPEFFPLYEMADKYSLTVFIHPYYTGVKPMMEKYYLTNTIGNPLETTIAISSLIFAGILEKYPRIKWVLAHGGGFFPYQYGRLEHGFEERTEARIDVSKPPSRYLKQIYCDTITHNLPALKYLIETMGSSNVVLGSDYPFDMADHNPVKSVLETAGVSADDKQKILGENALRILS